MTQADSVIPASPPTSALSALTVPWNEELVIAPSQEPTSPPLASVEALDLAGGGNGEQARGSAAKSAEAAGDDSGVSAGVFDAGIEKPQVLHRPPLDDAEEPDDVRPGVVDLQVGDRKAFAVEGSREETHVGGCSERDEVAERCGVDVRRQAVVARHVVANVFERGGSSDWNAGGVCRRRKCG